MPAYYNEIEPIAAQTLRNLISAGHIPAGDVDERDIRDVKPSNLDGYTQCHFFAGVGIWAMALRAAGWRDDQPIWTGSCPCQPLSAAGKGLGFDDERHLWPDWHWLIQQCRPKAILGEQVSSHDGLKWADLVQADLEASDYAFGPVDTCAAGFGGYHMRHRLYFASIDDRLANAAGQQRRLADGREWEQVLEDIWRGADGGLGNPDGPRTTVGLPEAVGRESRVSEVHDDRSCGLSGRKPGRPQSIGMDNPISVGRDTGRIRDHAGHERVQSSPAITDGRMADTTSCGRKCRTGLSDKGEERRGNEPSDCGGDIWPGAPDIRGASADWLHCRDGKWRPVRPGSFPLADASTGRVGQLHAIGNGLDLAQATAACRAFMERELGSVNAPPAHDLFEWSA